MRKIGRKAIRMALLAGCASIAAAGTAAHGQAPAEIPAVDPIPEAQAAEQDPSAEVVVTAQRRSQRLEEVPISIVAITGAALQSAGVTRFQDIGNVAAGVQVSRSGVFAQPSIRGITTLTTGQGYENNVAVYIDGFYQPDPITINGDLVNLADVQVLKGPQGTLYGRNATAGAILLTTLAPSSTWTGSGQVTYGRFDDKRAQAYISGPLGDNVAMSIAGYIRRSDGYIRDIAGWDVAPMNNDSLRAKLQFRASDALKITAGYNYIMVEDTRAGTFIEYANTPAVFPGTTIPTPMPPQGAISKNVSSVTRPTDVRTTLHQGTLTAELDTGIGILTSRTSYLSKHQNNDYDFDGTKTNASFTFNPGRQRNFQQSLDMVVNAIDGVDLVLGGSYYWDRYRTTNTGTSFGNFTNVQNVGQTSKAIAVYADITVEPVEHLFLTAGGRYASERKNGYYFFTPGNVPATLAPPADKKATFDGFTPRGVVRYEFGPRTSVYASYSKGFRTGTFPLSTFTNPALYVPVQPEKITAYELGFKTAGNGLRFDVAGYYYDFKDLQVGLSIPNPLAPATIIQRIGNAKRAESYGIDGSLTYTPNSDLTLRLGAAWVHARYKDFTNATGTGLNTATGLNATGQLQDWSGQQMARAPTFTANAGLEYGMDFAGGRLKFASNASYTTSFVISNPSLFGPLAGAALANKQRFRQDAYAILNAQVSWTDPSDRITATIYGDNITNSEFMIVSSGGAFGSYRVFGEPITYGFRLGYKF